MTATTLRREFLQLANKYKFGKSNVAGWYLSEKLDGSRCLWDGGLSRGLATESVPWASVIDPKTGLRKKKIKPIATGLWSRYGNPIIAPDWFLNLLPCVPLDGELWAGRGNFQLNRSIVAGDEPDPRFDQVSFAVFGCPSLGRLFQDGEIKNTNFHCQVSFEAISKWMDDTRVSDDFTSVPDGATFEEELLTLREYLDVDRVYQHPQIKLSNDETAARAQVEQELFKVIQEGGEGVILRDPKAIWTPKRVSSILKYKPYTDDEGTLVGYTSGRETDKGSKHRGKIGALILDYGGKRLEVSGLTDEEREFGTAEDTNFAFKAPGRDMPKGTRAKHFTLGQEITFRYRELTDDGIPKEASYMRVRDEE